MFAFIYIGVTFVIILLSSGLGGAASNSNLIALTLSFLGTVISAISLGVSIKTPVSNKFAVSSLIGFIVPVIIIMYLHFLK